MASSWLFRPKFLRPRVLSLIQRHWPQSPHFSMDSVVFSEQVGRGLAGCEVARLRGCEELSFSGLTGFFISCTMRPSSLWSFLPDVPLLVPRLPGLSLTASVHAKLEDSPEIKACRGARNNAKCEGKPRKRQRQ